MSSKKKMHAVNLRLLDDTLARADAICDLVLEHDPLAAASNVTRATIIRAAIDKGLPAVEAAVRARYATIDDDTGAMIVSALADDGEDEEEGGSDG